MIDYLKLVNFFVLSIRWPFQARERTTFLLLHSLIGCELLALFCCSSRERESLIESGYWQDSKPCVNPEFIEKNGSGWILPKSQTLGLPKNNPKLFGFSSNFDHNMLLLVQ